VTPAIRDQVRERAFALSAQGKGVREIARELQINKDTAVKLVREERQRRSHVRDAEDAVRDAVTSPRTILTDLPTEGAMRSRAPDLTPYTRG
jgi:transposase-like protein